MLFLLRTEGPTKGVPPGAAFPSRFHASLGRKPTPKEEAAVNTPRRPFPPPAWLLALRERNDVPGVRWHSAAQIRDASAPLPDAAGLLLPQEARFRAADEALLARMVSVADGPRRQDRTQRELKSRLFVDRESPHRLLLALAENHPPSLWVPAGQTRDSLAAALAAYCFDGLPPQQSLPFQGRLFLTTTAMLQDDFRAVENVLTRSAFTDALIWGSSKPTDPYGESEPLGRIPLPRLREYIGQKPGVLPRTSVRTRFSRAIIQAIDYNSAYFADLYFRPAPPEFAAEYRARHKTPFPPGTPADVIATLSGHGLLCLDAESMRGHLNAATDPNQRDGLRGIVEFIERGPGE